MTDTREKLIELIHRARYDVERICNERNDCTDCHANIHEGKCKAGYIADHLIANGVTVQQWIPVAERLPEPYVDVLVFRDGKILIDHHEEDGWFAHDFQGKRATHWMPLPEPPKEPEIQEDI